MRLGSNKNKAEKNNKTESDKQKGVSRESRLALLKKRFFYNKKAVLGLVILIIIAGSAIFAPFIAPHDPIEQDMMQRLQEPSWDHPLGTDLYGRDVLSRLIYGARISLNIGFISVGIGVLIGCSLGLIAGFYGGKLDNFIMRIMDVLLSLPSLLLALAIVSALGVSIWNLMVALGISFIPHFARLIRGSVLSVMEQEYIESARAIGSSDLRIIVRHIIPNSINPVIVQATLYMASSILVAAGLSFLGLGVQPPTPEWGHMIAQAREFIRLNHYPVTFSGIAIVLTVLSINLVGDGLRDALDPKTDKAHD